ncbi:MAG: translocation/assembly module TamB domain-containing protein [Luteolibacter sp.]
MAEHSEGIRKPARRGCRRLLVFGFLTLAAGWWLNGPGLRWLGPKVVSHFAAKSGAEVAFEIRGTLVGGLTLRSVEASIEGTPFKRIAIRELAPEYRVFRLLRGKVDGVSARGVHFDLEMGTSRVERAQPAGPVDFTSLNAALHELRSRLVGMGIDVAELTAVIDGPHMSRVELGPSAIRQLAGEERIKLNVGAIMRGGESISDAQEVVVDWTVGRISFDRIGLHAALVLTDFSISHPRDGGLFAEGLVGFADAVFQATSSPEQGTLAMHLREGSLDVTKVGEILNVGLPVTGTVTSFALDVADLAPDPRLATATMSVLLENAGRNGVVVDELNLDVILEATTARIVARAAVGEAEARVDSTSTFDRAAMAVRETRGRLDVPSVPPVLNHVLKMADDAEPLPVAAANAEFEVIWGEGFSAASAKADAVLVVEDPELATGLRIAAQWVKGTPAIVDLRADGLQARAVIDPDGMRYSGDVVLAGFKTSRLAVWLAPVDWALPGDAVIDATWQGAGPLTSTDGHEGDLSLESGLWVRTDHPDLNVLADVSYRWPGRLLIRDLQALRGGQSIHADLGLADGKLAIDLLRWTDAGGDELASARGSLPVPDDFSAWREFLAGDSQPLDLTIRTRKLTFEKLATWVPALKVVASDTTAELELVLTGNLAAPVVDASLDVRGIRMVDQPALPLADLSIQARGRDGVLVADGSLRTPDFAPAVLAAKLPFAPVAWAQDVDSLRAAEVEATVDLPRLDLSRFTPLVPVARSLAGVVTGKVRVGGTLGVPVLTGGLELTGGSLRLAHDAVPEITGIAAVADFDRDRAILRSLRATIAGGTFEATGTFAIPSRELDFRMRGNSLPLVRNNSLIVRAHADIRITGPFAQAAVSGSVSLVDSLFFRDIELLPIGAPFTGPQAAALPKIDTAPPFDAIPEPFANWAVDLRLATAEPLLIRGNLATGRILADVRIGGTLGDPRPDGTVRLLRGRAVLPFSTLAVPEAVFTFSPANRFDPVIEARGTAEPRPYTVNLFAYGRLSDPQIVLSSTPPLPQNEIMTLLATGTTTRGLEDPQMASARALQLFAEEVRRGRVPMSNQLRPLLGLFDRVDFTLAEPDPYSSDTFSTATLKLHDRWYLSAGMGGEGNTRMFAIWRLRFR